MREKHSFYKGGKRIARLIRFTKPAWMKDRIGAFDETDKKVAQILTEYRTTGKN